MVIATIALGIALTQTAIASPVALLTELVSGDKVIKKSSLSGNRLRKHTLTGTQINMAKLGTVPRASLATNAARAGHAASADTATNAVNALHADSADSATNALHANSADSATNATNAAALGGSPATAFERSGRILSGQATVNGGLIFTDPSTGAMIGAGSNAAQLVVTNPAGSTTTLQADLLVYYNEDGGQKLMPESHTIAPGSSATFVVDAAAFTLATGEISAVGASGSVSQLAITCQDLPNGLGGTGVPPSTVLVCTGLH